MLQRNSEPNKHLELPQKISPHFLIKIPKLSDTVMSVLNTDQVYFVHQQMSQNQYNFKLSKQYTNAQSIIPLTASVLIGNNRHAYAIYPYAVAGIGQNKVKLVQDIDTFKWYVVKKFTYKPTNEIEMLKKNNRFVSYLEIEPKSNKNDFYSSIYNMLYQFGLISGKHYVVQKLIDGETLLELSYSITCSSLSEKIKTALDILTCIEQFHKKNIVHRDIKGGNLMYDNKKQKWALVDFGEAIDRSEIPLNGRMNDCPGTDDFDSPETSPEFYKENGYTLPSYKSDIYSLGIVFKKYIFCTEQQLENSNDGQAILFILNSMTNNSATLRPNIHELIINFQSQLDAISNSKQTSLTTKSFKENSSLKRNFTVFNRPVKDSLTKAQQTEYLEAQLNHIGDELGQLLRN